MSKYGEHFATRVKATASTPQSQPIPGREAAMTANSAGGYSFAVDDWTRARRFLVLGAEGGTYYIRERELTRENAGAILRCLGEDGPRLVALIVEVSEAGRAPKNQPALFALAMAAGAADDATRTAALTALPRVARTGTHLHQFVDYVQHFRGWGRGLRTAVSQWFMRQDERALAYQLLKYGQRDGWAMLDVMRMAHKLGYAAPRGTPHDMLYRYLRVGYADTVLPARTTRDGRALPEKRIEGVQTLLGEYPALRETEAGRLIEVVESLKGMTPTQAARVIRDNPSVVREMVPTELLNSREVWAALLQSMPLGALVRNLGVLTKHELLKPLTPELKAVTAKLADAAYIAKARLHPLNLLLALKTYQSGGGMRGGNAWTPVAQVVDALDGAFYLAFGAVPATGKGTLIALDVSGSMSAPISGSPLLSCREASAAMAMVTAAVEPNYHVIAFSAGGFSTGGRSRWGSGNDGVTPVNLSPRMRLDAVLRESSMSFGGTDCALPMLYAQAQNLDVETFLVYTDSETWAGNVQPVQALNQYRQHSGRPAKLVVVGMASNGFTIADPDDAGMLDVVGFDTSAPAVISDFAMA